MNMEIFRNSEFGSIRVIEEDGKYLFCGSDVAKALGYSNPRKAVRDHARGGTKRSIPTASGDQTMTFLPEGDVYRLIVHSRLPGAERFEKWVFDEVLPTIRRTGGYMTPSLLEEAARHPEILLSFADQLLAEHEKNRRLTGEVERLRPKADFYDAFVRPGNCTNIRATAKELGVGERDFCRFLICYLVLPFIFFSASTGKLATYILPCFPPAAILLAIGLKKYIEDNRQHKTLDWTLIILPWVLIAGAAGFTIVQILMYFDLIPTLFTKNEWYKWVIAGVAVIFWCWMILKNRNADVKKKIIAFFAGMIPVLMAGQMAFPEHVLHGKIQEAPLQRLTAYIPENSQILVQHNVMHAVSWVTQRDDLDFFLTAGELNHSVQEDYPDEYGERLYGLGQFRKWVKSPERTRPLVVICRIRKEKFDKDYNHYFKDVEEYIKAQYYDEEIYMVVF